MQHSNASAAARQRLIAREWKEFAFTLYDSIHPVLETWNGVVGESNVFLSGEYLHALEGAPPDNMDFFYVTVTRGSDCAGVIYLQLKHFSASKSLNYDRNGLANAGRAIVKSIRDFIANRIEFYTLVCGNALVTGQHGYLFREDITQEEQVAIVDVVLDWVKGYLSREGRNVDLIFIKDFFTPVFSRINTRTACMQYHQLSAQPNMIMDLNPEWRTYKDYLAALQSKYRVRAKRARRMSKGITKHHLDLDQLVAMRGLLYDYYRQIADAASFNLFILHPDYLVSLKKSLGPLFTVIGYFSGGELIAFYSTIVDGRELEAHFLGYDDEVNREHQLYLNMLLDMIDMGIERKSKRIIFARTALEIKSSVGAKPHDMYFYLQHNKGLQNFFLPFYYNMLDPKEEWVPRHPFKKLLA